MRQLGEVVVIMIMKTMMSLDGGSRRICSNDNCDFDTNVEDF